MTPTKSSPPMKSFLVLALVISSCTNTASEWESLYPPSQELLSEINGEIDQISNSEDLAEYLENIHYLDQKYRLEEGEIVETFGDDSEEHKAIRKLIHKTDAENYFRIAAILRHFNYPKVDSVGEEAASTPWIVIHHSPLYEHRVKHFEILYNAYINGNLNESRFCLMLERMYHWKHKSIFEMPSPYLMGEKLTRLLRC